VKLGNAQLALVAAIVVGEVAPQQLVGAQRLTKTDLLADVKKDPDGDVTLDLPEKKLDDVVSVATGGPDRRFRAEAILNWACPCARHGAAGEGGFGVEPACVLERPDHR
jgi:hypothetical protein